MPRSEWAPRENHQHLVAKMGCQQIAQVISLLCHEFDCRDLGSLGFFLGLEISSNFGTLLLTQTWYATDLLNKFNMENCSPCRTHLRSGSHLKPDEGETLPNPTVYRSIVGRLQYLSLSRLTLLMQSIMFPSFFNSQELHIFKWWNEYCVISKVHYIWVSSSLLLLPNSWPTLALIGPVIPLIGSLS